MVSVSSANRPATYMNKAAVKPAAAATKTQMLAMKNLPLDFIPNRGQVDGQVSFYIKGSDRTVYFTPGGMTLALHKTEVVNKVSGANNPADMIEHKALSGKSWVIKMDFIGARKDAAPEGLERSGAVFSYFKGGREDWQAGLPGYRRIIYRELWPGVDLVYMGDVGRLKYEFVLRPGADPRLIKLGVSGASDVKIDGEGQLVLETQLENIVDEKPFAYQEAPPGERRLIQAAYAIKKTSEERVQVGFSLADYNRNLPLVIDPATFVYCGYIGGAGAGECDIAVDRSGNAYVAGSTWSDETAFPVTVGPDILFNGIVDAFVVKVNAAGTGLCYCGYIGGGDFDFAYDIAVDGSGNAYVVGITESDEASFPVINGPDTTYHGGCGDAFVAKVNVAGTGLDYCGYIGGSKCEFGYGIALDRMGNAYVTGQTSSDETTFPVIIGPDLIKNGDYDAFVAKVNASGTGLVYCGYIGCGSGKGIAVDEAGNAYIVGDTGSDETSFPVIIGPDVTFNGDTDTFVAKVKASGTGFVYCGYIGGAGREEVGSIAVDGLGNAYITGYTSSDETSFPVISGPDVTYNGDLCDAFVAKVSAAGTGLDYCGYIGGSRQDGAFDIAVNRWGNAYVMGWTCSDESSFPLAGGPDSTFNSGGDPEDPYPDTFVAKVSVSGTRLVYCGYIGGEDYEEGYGIAIDGSGNAYVVGWTCSDESSFPVRVGPDMTLNADEDVFIAKIRMFSNRLKSADIGLYKRVDNGTPSVGDTVVFQVVVNNFGPATACKIKVKDKLPAGLAFVSASATQGSYYPADGRWRVGKLRIGEKAVLTVRARVDRSGTMVNRAALLSLDKTERNSANNTAKASLQADPKKIFAPLESSEQE